MPADSPGPLEGLPGASPALRALAARGVRHAYRKGRLLIQEGEQGDTLFIVLSGRLRAYAANPDSGREITFGTYGPGEYVGEMSLDGGPRSANVEAATRAECALVTRATLAEFIAARPEFAFELLSKVITRARAATLSARQMALNDVYGRLRLHLESQARPDAAGGRSLRPRPTHLEIAQAIGCTREMVSRVLKQLERAGCVEVDARALRLVGEWPVRW